MSQQSHDRWNLEMKVGPTRGEGRRVGEERRGERVGKGKGRWGGGGGGGGGGREGGKGGRYVLFGSVG